MGFLGKLFGGGRTKEDLIRTLVKKRVSGDGAATSVGATPGAIDELSPEMLACLPEATIVWIVEHWVQGRSHQMPEQQIFLRIEAHRSMAAQGQLPAAPTLSSYVRYRIDLEHGHGVPLSAPHIEHCIREARQFFEAGSVLA